MAGPARSAGRSSRARFMPPECLSPGGRATHRLGFCPELAPTIGRDVGDVPAHQRLAIRIFAGAAILWRMSGTVSDNGVTELAAGDRHGGGEQDGQDLHVE